MENLQTVIDEALAKANETNNTEYEPELTIDWFFGEPDNWNDYNYCDFKVLNYDVDIWQDNICYVEITIWD